MLVREGREALLSDPKYNQFFKNIHKTKLQFINVECSGASTYERPYLQPFRFMNSSGHKVLLQFTTGALTYNQGGGNHGEVGESGKFELSVNRWSAKRLLVCTSFTPAVRKCGYGERLQTA